MSRYVWWEQLNVVFLHFPLRSVTSPSAARSHLSHRKTCVSGSSGLDPDPSASLRTSTRLQCQSRFGHPAWASSRSRTRTRRPRELSTWTRTGHACQDTGREHHQSKTQRTITCDHDETTSTTSVLKVKQETRSNSLNQPRGDVCPGSLWGAESLPASQSGWATGGWRFH